MIDLLFPHIGEAIRRAASLEQRQRYDEANPVPNPSTQAHHLAEFLCEMDGVIDRRLMQAYPGSSHGR